MGPVNNTWARMAACLIPVLFMLSNHVLATQEGMPGSPRTLAIVHASVIPMTRELVLPDQTVLISDGRIQTIGPSDMIKVPVGTTRVDATGKYLLPAFCDMHTHVLGVAWNMLLSPEDRVSAPDLDMEAFLFPYIANGVTTIQVLSATEDHTGLRDSIEKGELMGPRLVLARMIDGPDKAWPPPLSTWVASPTEAYEAVLDARRVGYDAIKAYSFLSQDTYDAIISAARDTGMDVIGHIPLESSVEHVVASGQRLIAHSEELMKHANGNFSEESVHHFANIIAGSEVWLVPTLVTSRSILDVFENSEAALARPESRYFQHPMQQGVWSFIMQNLYRPIPGDQRQFIRRGFEQFQIPLTRALYQRGVKLLAGTDTPLPTLVPGFALHRELQELVEAGLSPYEALRSSTTHPFEYLGEIDDAGTVEQGKLANLVLLNSNPLTDIGNSSGINGVVYRGRWLSADQIQDSLRLIVAPSE